jgi:threonine dehydratase
LIVAAARNTELGEREPLRGDVVVTPVRAVRHPTVDDLDRAWRVVHEYLQPSPLVATNVAADTWLKVDCWQPTGSFKVRGALAALSALDERSKAAGVVAASAGNHGLGVAHGATRLGIPATIVVPRTASVAKVAALAEFAVELVQQGDDYGAAEAYAISLATNGREFISPYNDPNVIAGQATIGRELADELTPPLTVVAPVGGGGLVAGLSLWATTRPGVRVVGVEADASRAVSAAVNRGSTAPVPIANTLADGLAGNLEPGSITPEIIAKYTQALTSVTEAEIRDGMRFLAAEHGLVVEGSGAVALAALRAGRVAANGRTAVVVTGRNIALPALAEVLAAGH